MNEYLELFNTQLSKIEELVERLLRRKYESARDLWLIQTDLARHQIEVRKEITKQKGKQKQINANIADTANRCEGSWREAIQEFQAELKRADMYIHGFGAKVSVDAKVYGLMQNYSRACKLFYR
jgi:hypothetical protein